MVEALPEKRAATHSESGSSSRHIRVLAYVHLRNIYASTGAGRVARQITEHIAKRSDTSLHILADAADQARIKPIVGEPWRSYKYHLFLSDTSYQQAKWFAFSAPLAESYWPEVEVVYCTAESYVPTKKAALVVTLHDAAYLEDGAHERDLQFHTQRLKWKYLYRRLVKKADLFHTVSNFSAERLIHYLPDIRNRVRVVSNGVTPHFFESVEEAGLQFLKGVGLSVKQYVLVPGGLHFRKNAELILQAWPMVKSRNPQVSLVVVNNSDSRYVERALALGAHMLGFVPDVALHALYSSAAVVWFPSRYEGFGLPVVEAMACGSPVVASNASSLPEIAGDAAVLASAVDPSEHADALVQLLDDSNWCGELRRKGRLHASKFTWDHSASQLRSHFADLI